MDKIKEVKIKGEFITLGQFLKIVDLVNSGGETKLFLTNNLILVNDEKDNRRGRKLYKKDLIEVDNQKYLIC